MEGEEEGGEVNTRFARHAEIYPEPHPTSSTEAPLVRHGLRMSSPIAC